MATPGPLPPKFNPDEAIRGKKTKQKESNKRETGRLRVYPLPPCQINSSPDLERSNRTGQSGPLPPPFSSGQPSWQSKGQHSTVLRQSIKSQPGPLPPPNLSSNLARADRYPAPPGQKGVAQSGPLPPPIVSKSPHPVRKQHNAPAGSKKVIGQPGPLPPSMHRGVRDSIDNAATKKSKIVRPGPLPPPFVSGGSVRSSVDNARTRISTIAQPGPLPPSFDGGVRDSTDNAATKKYRDSIDNAATRKSTVVRPGPLPPPFGVRDSIDTASTSKSTMVRPGPLPPSFAAGGQSTTDNATTTTLTIVRQGPLPPSFGVRDSIENAATRKSTMVRPGPLPPSFEPPRPETKILNVKSESFEQDVPPPGPLSPSAYCASIPPAPPLPGVKVNLTKEQSFRISTTTDNEDENDGNIHPVPTKREPSGHNIPLHDTCKGGPPAQQITQEFQDVKQKSLPFLDAIIQGKKLKPPEQQKQEDLSGDLQSSLAYVIWRRRPVIVDEDEDDEDTSQKWGDNND